MVCGRIVGFGNEYRNGVLLVCGAVMLMSLAACKHAEPVPAPTIASAEAAPAKDAPFVLRRGQEVTLVERTDGVLVLDLAGSAFQRGVQHGQALKPLISRGILEWKRWIAQRTGKDADFVIKSFLDNTNHIAASELHTPGCSEEVRGIANGAGLDFKLVFAYQLLDELVAYLAARDVMLLQSIGAHGTSLGIYGRTDRPTLLGHNNDLPTFFTDAHVLLRFTDPESNHKILQLTWAGVIAQGGANDQGLGVVVNALHDAKGELSGVPMVCASRAILNTSSVDEAIVLLKSRKLGAPTNFVIGDPQKAVTVEVSTRGVDVIAKSLGKTMVVHTNHIIGAATGQGDPAGGESATPGFTVERITQIAKELRAHAETIGVADIKKLLSTPPVCVVGDKAEERTMASVIMELSESPTLQIAVGPPCRKPYAAFDSN